MGEVIRIAGIGDTHFGASNSRHRRNGIHNYSHYREHVRNMSRNADVIVHCGDFTDKGDERSLKIAAGIFSDANKPVIGVLGNHDVRGDPAMAKEILEREGGITILEGNAVRLSMGSDKVGFVGTPGFAERRLDQFIRHLTVSQEEYDHMVQRQRREFRKTLRRLRPGINVAIFHFEQVEFDESDSQRRIVLTDFGQMVDSHADKISLMLHGHDHRSIDRPPTTPQKVPVHDVAAKIHIEASGVPYKIIEVPIYQS